MTDNQFEVKFNSREGGGHRKAVYSTGDLSVHPFRSRDFELYVVPQSERLEGEGSIIAEVTYIVNQFDRGWMKRVLGWKPSGKRLGRIDLVEQEIIMRGDICYSATIEELMAKAIERGIPFDEKGLNALMNPIAQDYLRFNQRLQEHQTQLISRREVKS